jgi:hypothetical protein
MQLSAPGAGSLQLLTKTLLAPDTAGASGAEAAAASCTAAAALAGASDALHDDDPPPPASLLPLCRTASAPAPALLQAGVPLFMAKRAAAAVGPAEDAQRCETRTHIHAHKNDKQKATGLKA